MNKYTKVQAIRREEINNFPIGFAFSNKQFEEAKEKLNVKSNDELLKTQAGGFIRKADKEAYTALFAKIDKEDKEFLSDDDYMFQGFLYELANHEFCYTGDPTDTLICFGLSLEDLYNDSRLLEIFKKAKSEYYSQNEDF